MRYSLQCFDDVEREAGGSAGRTNPWWHAGFLQGGGVVTCFQIPVTMPLGKFLLNKGRRSVLAIVPSDLTKVGETLSRPVTHLRLMVVSRLRVVKVEQ